MECLDRPHALRVYVQNTSPLLLADLCDRFGGSTVEVVGEDGVLDKRTRVNQLLEDILVDKVVALAECLAVARLACRVCVVASG